MVGLLAGLPAAAAPAGLSVSDAGDCELAVGSSWQRDTDGARTRSLAAALECGLREGLEAQFEVAEERSGTERARTVVLGGEMQLLGAAPGASRAWLSTLGASLELGGEPGRGWRAQQATLEFAAAVELWPDGWLDVALAARRDRPRARWRSPWAVGLEQETVRAGTWRLELAGTGGERPQALLEWTGELADGLDLQMQAGATLGRPRAREFGMALKFEF